LSRVEIRQLADQGATKMEWRRRARPAGILPLGFAGQAVETARALAQLVAKRHGVVPNHLLHRPLLAINPKALKLRRVGAHHPPPLGLGDRCLAHPEAVKIHPVLGAFVV
jgi:hypothetical protein